MPRRMANWCLQSYAPTAGTQKDNCSVKDKAAAQDNTVVEEHVTANAEIFTEAVQGPGRPTNSRVLAVRPEWPARMCNACSQ